MEKKEIHYRVIRSDRRSISIQISPEGEVLVRCPRTTREEDIRTIVEQNRQWVEKHLAKLEDRPRLPRFTEEEVRQMADLALAVLPQRVDHFAKLLGVTYGRITVRNQRTKWGSCSSKGNLSFNCVLMGAPGEVVDYIVVHELCHRKHMDHSPEFWAEVERLIPDYRTHKKWLNDHGDELIGRL